MSFCYIRVNIQQQHVDEEMMSDLDELLMKNRWTLYNSNEMSEILLSLYNTLSIAFKIKAKTLTAFPLQILCLDKEQKIIYQFPPEPIEIERISNIDVLDLILARDETVREHLELISRSPEKSIYRIKNL